MIPVAYRDYAGSRARLGENSEAWSRFFWHDFSNNKGYDRGKDHSHAAAWIRRTLGLHTAHTSPTRERVHGWVLGGMHLLARWARIRWRAADDSYEPDVPASAWSLGGMHSLAPRARIRSMLSSCGTRSVSAPTNPSAPSIRGPGCDVRRGRGSGGSSCGRWRGPSSASGTASSPPRGPPSDPVSSPEPFSPGEGREPGGRAGARRVETPVAEPLLTSTLRGGPPGRPARSSCGSARRRSRRSRV